MAEINSCLYPGHVMHERLMPFRHHLGYTVSAMLLDLDELPQLDTGTIWFGYNRKTLLGFNDRDHGPRDGTPIREWVNKQLTDANLENAKSKIRILCFPSVLGYVFNPLSIYFCYDASEKLAAILYEVKNTFSEQHGYLFAVPPEAPRILEHDCAKEFYVSPFIDMKADYHFRIAPPHEHFNLLIRQKVANGELLRASWTGKRQPWSLSAVKKTFWAYPLLTLKIITGIHWHALKLWLKGAKYHSRPAIPEHDVTFIK